jgi:toxin ParE1/3/4
MKYRLLDRAEQDLEAIADDLAEINPRAALVLVERFHSRWELLGDFPLSGPARPDLSPDARHVVIDDYLTLYRVRNGRNRPRSSRKARYQAGRFRRLMAYSPVDNLMHCHRNP